MTLLIAGAGIAGLVLANLLEQLDIDYLVLEGYHSVTPDAGASIVLHPHGLRVLDQIGVYEKIAAISAPADVLNHRTESGKLLYTADVAVETKRRHFYEVFFLARSELLRILYENIKDKSKIRSSEKVLHVEHTSEGVEVTTSSGSVFKGYGLVGADGVHSTIRKEMWRMADEENPGTLQKDESIPCEYGCVFGISNPTGGIPASEANAVHMQDHTISVMAGLNDKLFWFLFFKLKGPKTYPGIHAIPRFVPDDHAELAAANKDVQVTEAVSFGQIYANRTHATITALPHINFRAWNYRRVMLIGDSAHKFNPISGEGGNAAIEDAAVLASRLHELLQAKHRIPVDEKRSQVGENEISAMFEHVHAERRERVKGLVAGSHEAMQATAWGTRFSKFWDTLVLPKLPSNTLQEGTSAPVLAGPHCTALPLPTRKHAVPFNDEKAHQNARAGTMDALAGCWK